MKLFLCFLSNLERIKYCALLFLMLLPTFWMVNNKNCDWGDDFAQYIYQAQQIHTPSQSYNKVLNIEELSSSKRSLFFSLVLSFIAPTTTIAPYLNLISWFYILAGIVCFLFCTLKFSFRISFIITLCLFYNFLFLKHKNEIMPEFIFITLFYAIIHLIIIDNKKLKYIIPFIIALLISVRFIGFVLLVAYVLHVLMFKQLSKKEKLKQTLTIVVITLCTLISINLFFLSNVENREAALYSSSVLESISFKTVIENVLLYTKHILCFFEQEIPFYLNYIIAFLAVVFFTVGLFFSVKRNFGIIELTFLVYLICLFIFPYAGDAIRYLIPIVPLFFYYMVNGVLFSSNFLILYFQHQVAIWFLIIVFLSNANTIWLFYQTKKDNLGPYSDSVQQDFKKVSQYCKPNETIAFSKPFLINLFCDRNSYFLTNSNYNNLINKADYFLISKPDLGYLYLITNEIKLNERDTIPLNHFYLVKLKTKKFS